jgi:glyoxylase-like metal-dependent hydrolase (beta-lactamase superfamily II)
MTQISRRTFVASAATTAAVLGLDKPLAFVAPAAAQGAMPTHKTFKVGDLEVTTVYDGIWEKAHDPGFVKNASLDDVKKALRDAGQTDAFVPVTFTVTVVKRGDAYILFDSSTGGQGSPKAGQFLANLKAAGIDKAKIKTVVVTHYHPDHIFGLMEKGTDAQVYPDAEIIVPAAEHAFWNDPATLTKMKAREGMVKRIQKTLGTWKNVRPVDGAKEVVAGVTALPTSGHTPGHTAYVVSGGNGQVIVAGDITNIPSLFVKNPGWHAAFDMDAGMAEAARRRLFDRAIADKVTLTGYHWGMPGAGTIVKDGNGYMMKPVA